jgi:endonuclease/exonuclease/phosphatase family metal-dependent hydrolase
MHNLRRRRHIEMLRRFSTGKTFAIAAAIAFCLGASTARADEGKRVLKVMTRNMDAGTDLNLIFAYYPDIATGVSATLTQVVTTNVPGRAKRLAEEIRHSKPDFVALQEVTTWETGNCGATTVLYDQLQLLLAALAGSDTPYTTVGVNVYSSIEAPAQSGCVKLTDRDAILVRSDLKPPDVQVTNVQSFRYALKLDVSQVGILGLPPISRGYMTADVTAGSDTFRLVNTHLESTYPAFDPHGLLQSGQTVELLTALAAAKLPVVLMGDFNSNAELGPEQTPTVGLILGAGFTDVWRQFNPAGTGYTWPLYNEDAVTGPAVPTERIDLIFTRDMRALKVEQTGVDTPPSSDHAGVVAMLQTGK